jgi:hypothetical protein
MSKLRLDPELLKVQSFATDEGEAARRGTVRAAADHCTHAASCPCPTNLYQCGTLHATLVSCDYTKFCDTAADCETLDCPPNTDVRTCPC